MEENRDRFTLSSLAEHFDALLDVLPVDSVRRHLDVLTARGLIKAVSHRAGRGSTMSIFDRFISSKPPSKDTFAKAVRDGIVRAGEKQAVVYDKDQFALRTPEKDGHRLNLGNAYPEFFAAPKARRAELVKKWIRVWFSHRIEIPSDFEDVRPDLLPTVQARSHYELVDLQSEVEGRGRSNRPYQIFGEHFAAGLVYDLPESMQHVTQDNLDEWGVTLYEALEVARQNLAEKQFAFLGPGEGEGISVVFNAEG